MTLANRGVKYAWIMAQPCSPLPPKPDFSDAVFTRSVNWDSAMRAANRMFDGCAEASRLPDRGARLRQFAQIAGEIGSSTPEPVRLSYLEKYPLGQSNRADRVGNYLLAGLLRNIVKVHDAVDRSEQGQRNLQVALALAAFHADTGHYPAKLDDLAPKYLAKVPGDLFSGKPLIYKPEKHGYLLYSVGVNGNDDGGRWYSDEPRGDDPRCACR